MGRQVVETGSFDWICVIFPPDERTLVAYSVNDIRNLESVYPNFLRDDERNVVIAIWIKVVLMLWKEKRCCRSVPLRWCNRYDPA